MLTGSLCTRAVAFELDFPERWGRCHTLLITRERRYNIGRAEVDAEALAPRRERLSAVISVRAQISLVNLLCRSA